MAQLNAMRKITAEKLGIDVTKPVTGAGFVKNPEYNPNDALSKRYVPSGQPVTTEIKTPAPTKVPEIVPPAPTGTPEGIKAVFGDRPVPRAVRLAGEQDVFTIGDKGKWIETPKEFEDIFGTREQAGIVGEITPEQAKLLNIRPEGVAELKATRQRDADKKELFDLGQQAGLSFEEATSLVNSQFPVDTGEIREDLGISDVAEKLFTMPEKTIQETYQEAYEGSDLPDLKNRIRAIDDKIASRESDLVKATGELNNNPWLSQASRTGRLRILNELAFADIGNLESQRTSYMDLYDKGIDDLEGVMTRASDQLQLQREMTAEQFNYLLGEAERIEDERLQGLTMENLRFAPEFLRERIAKQEEEKFTTEEKIELGYTLDASGNLVPPTLAPTGDKTGGSMSWRNNNPGNIKFGAFAEQYGATKGAEATDGGNFAIFPDEATGQQAMVDLLQSPNYRDLTLDQAMKRWSNNGYGAEIIKNANPDILMRDIPEEILNNITIRMREREGWTEGTEFDTLGVYPESSIFNYNEKLDINRIPALGGKQITNKTARGSNLPFGVTDKQADWIIDHRLGNIQFQQLKSKDVKSLNDLVELREDINDIRELKKKINTGPVAARTGRALRFSGVEDSIFNQLEIKSGKQLAEFIKEISGAAVSEQEAQRLAKLVPNVEMQDQQFIDSLDDMEDGLNGLIAAKIIQFDLEDEEMMIKAIRGEDIDTTSPDGFSDEEAYAEYQKLINS